MEIVIPPDLDQDRSFKPVRLLRSGKREFREVARLGHLKKYLVRLCDQCVDVLAIPVTSRFGPELPDTIRRFQTVIQGQIIQFPETGRGLDLEANGITGNIA